MTWLILFQRSDTCQEKDRDATLRARGRYLTPPALAVSLLPRGCLLVLERPKGSVAEKETDASLAEQLAYYDARAGEYEDAYLRTGRYDRDPASNRSWLDEIRRLRNEVEDFRPTGRILELACGTGIWTERLARFGCSITAVDASPGMLTRARARLAGAGVEFVQQDVFAYEPTERFDVVFFSLWLSHVPPLRFEAFWKRVRDWLRPQGRLLMIDALYHPDRTAVDEHLASQGDTSIVRRLNDGRSFRIIKVFYDLRNLEARLARLGFKVELRPTGQFFFIGSGHAVLGERVQSPGGESRHRL